MVEGSKTRELFFDEIGYWSEVKLDIIREYAQEYSIILSKQQLAYAYIDGFAGSGVHISKGTREFVPGSPLNALRIQPPFHEYYLVDLDGNRIKQLRNFPEVKNRPEVHVIQGNCNEVLLSRIFPKVRYEDYRRALCLLDPYALHLNWNVVERAGKMRSVEIFLNFPIMDINRTALWLQPEKVADWGITRMNSFWGDESWRKAAYAEQATLFGEPDYIKRGNQRVVEAYCERLKSVGGFGFVPEPMPMRNSNNAVVYYLVFASQKPVAERIVRHIFNKHRDRRG